MTKTNDQNQGCLAAIFQIFKRNPEVIEPEKDQPLQKYPYQLRESFLSPAEFAFYKVLASAIPANAVILSKTRMADIIKVDRTIVPYSSEARLYFNQIVQKHIDFLVCQRETLNPLVGIELDDTNHSEPDKLHRDDFVDNAFEAANLPLVRVQALEAYDEGEVTRILSPYWGLESAPHCPKCDRPMLIRTAKSGEHEGKKFYVCPDTKNCRTYFPA